ncbi:MAG: 16S rRNA (cytosine(1402)-N(4))-methyltransferase RsmH [Legionellaceae bacterium]|nr:16S rRNA (cytosine(1402)-N(4))-methyltransferase RsmH [Legionellaceae bacterium]
MTQNVHQDLTHETVMLSEAVDALAIRPAGFYIDGTYGRGGHSAEILKHLSADGRLLVIDKDPAALRHAQETLGSDPRVLIQAGSFSDLLQYIKNLDLVGKVDGILFDLGVSSPQIDDPERGFSFRFDGPLDMRMDTRQPITAAHFVNTASQEDMMRIFFQYGEERFSRRIAAAIVEARNEKPFERTQELVAVIRQASPGRDKNKHPATRVFQAIRIHINQELQHLEQGLEAAYQVLAIHGRLVVISFHSLEDRIVKHFLRDKVSGVEYPPEIPIQGDPRIRQMQSIGKARKSGSNERNVRARSAVLRIGEKML